MEHNVKALYGFFLLICLIDLFYAKNSLDVVIVVAIVLSAALTVRGYSIYNGKLLIHRLCWSKKFDLSKLTDVEFSSDVMMGSVRMWGIGGLFGYIGYFRNNMLGKYRAYATNKENTVVLDFNGKKVVITPATPSEFVEKLLSEQKKINN